jgi:hypothetical protein
MNYNLPPDEGKKKKDLYWTVCIVLAIISFISISIAAASDDPGRYSQNPSGGWDWEYICDNGERINGFQSGSIEDDGIEDCNDGSDEVGSAGSVYETCGGAMCCFSLIFAISALSTKNDTRRVVVVQQQPQYIPVVQQVIQQPSLPTRPNPPAAPIKNKTMWIAEARNLELARNWEGAADAYQKAGMYEEAGRIRQEHLEQNQPVVQIGHVGNTVLNDSVIIAESTPKTCNSCGNVSEPSWKICPHCSNPL